MLGDMRTEYEIIYVPEGTPEIETLEKAKLLGEVGVKSFHGYPNARVLVDLFKHEEQLVPGYTTYILILYFFL